MSAEKAAWQAAEAPLGFSRSWVEGFGLRVGGFRVEGRRV